MLENLLGEEGMGFLPYLTTLFWFILVCNLFEIIPIFQFPPMARMAMPMVLALITWVIYNGVGFKHQKLSYIKIVRPFSLAVRLFANMLAGHLLLVTFALLTDALIFHDGVKAGGFPLFSPLAILPLAMDIGITGFEVLVAVLQAFIFTILTAVYIGGSMHPEH